MQVVEQTDIAFIWIAIISSVIVLIGYTIWNFFTVLFDLMRLGREARGVK